MLIWSGTTSTFYSRNQFQYVKKRKKKDVVNITETILSLYICTVNYSDAQHLSDDPGDILAVLAFYVCSLLKNTRNYPNVFTESCQVAC